MQMQLESRFFGRAERVWILVVNLQQDNTRTVRSSLLLLFGAVGCAADHCLREYGKPDSRAETRTA
jgi:hypothetical protein